VSPDPFIRDAAFRGSPILSYGTASRGSAWPKFLALIAGIFVVVLLVVFSWFWFFTNIPMPLNSTVFTVLPADAALNTKAPLVWKQSQALNKPLPTIAGLSKQLNVSGDHSGKSLGYAIRLTPATAIVGKTRLWELVSDEKIEVESFKSPFDVFGWPWEMFNGQMKLNVAVRDLFSTKELSWDELPDMVEGTVIGNKWKTNLFIQKNITNKTNIASLESGFVRFDAGTPDVLKNFLQYHGAWADFAESGEFTWRFDPSLVTLDYFDGGESRIDWLNEDEFIKQDFVLDDEYVAKRIYLLPGNASSSSGVASSSGALAISVEQSGMGIISNSVNELTCEGNVLAKFDHQSIQNFCSWFDICFFEYANLVLLNEGGYLTACGY
jgi:hypothetical protein